MEHKTKTGDESLTLPKRDLLETTARAGALSDDTEVVQVTDTLTAAMDTPPMSAALPCRQERAE